MSTTDFFNFLSSYLKQAVPFSSKTYYQLTVNALSMSMYHTYHCRLKNNKIRMEGAIAFSTLLKSNKSLLYLDLDRNRLGDAGAEVLAEALKMNNSLKRLR